MKRIRALILAALLAGGSLAFAACGDDDAPANQPTSTTTADDMSDDEMTDDEMTDDMSDDDMSDEEMTDEEMSDEEMTDDDMTETTVAP
jgi:hypothetical protein